MKRGHEREIGLWATGGAGKAKCCGHPVGERRTRRSQMVSIFFPTHGRTLGPFIMERRATRDTECRGQSSRGHVASYVGRTHGIEGSYCTQVNV